MAKAEIELDTTEAEKKVNELITKLKEASSILEELAGTGLKIEINRNCSTAMDAGVVANSSDE